MARSRARHLLSAILLTFLACALSPPSTASAATRKKITRAAEVPPLYFRAPPNPDELAATPEAFAPLAAAVRAHVEGVLRDYDIEDRTTLKNLHITLAHLDLLDGRDDEVLEHVNAARQLEEKTEERLLGITFYSGAIAWARRDAGRGSGEFFLHSLRGYINQYLNGLRWEDVREAIARDRALLDLTTEHTIPSWLRTRSEPDAVPADGTVSLHVADRVIFERVLLTLILPVKNEFMQAFESLADAHQSEDRVATGPVDIWRSRTVTLKDDSTLRPVVVAIWDSGVDTSAFSGQLYVNKRERLNGQDNDGNGFVSDVNGIGFRYDGERTPELCYPIDREDQALLEKERTSAQRKADFFSGIDSPEARAYKQGIAEGGGDAPRADDAEKRITSHTHGTEVADIAVAGNPAARLLIVRQSFRDDRGESPLMDVAGWRRFALNALSIVGYCKAHGVRVVNMSWSLSPPSTASASTASGSRVMEQEEGMRFARECFGIIKRGLTLAIQSAPEILFVAAAGNANEDATFSEGIPPSLELPNLLTVGAVDPAGHATEFTSFGKTVVLYANGKSIEARIPGGERMTVSGTSLAAPQVTNLAAKLLAIDPSLKVADVIDLIQKGASPSPDGTISLINPKRSVVLLSIRQDRKHGR
jgi:subtilisin family serine protease